MRKLFFIISLLPFLSCAKSNESSLPEMAYAKESKTISKVIDHQKWHVLLQKHVSAKGNVNYPGFKKDAQALQVYLDELSANVPQKSWSKNAVLAYWINAYNAFTVKLILDNYPVKSIKDIKDPWGKKFFILGTKKYSLEEIEHEILRKMDEPRIHFAINCASFSCPNLSNEAFIDTKLEKQLDVAAKAFVNDKTKNTIQQESVEISKIFDWFSGDFKSNGSIVDYLNQYSTIKISKKAKIKFKEYNWSLND
ncbi:DUF547 domain-containing protein [Flavobacterium sp. j3]|uniref:DUF547 domain-containing protein n=1 Tax=Flavobacterium aureirubrum TaxID=3133147 RepID=A0ABU9N7V1_9FLAO